MIVTKSTELKEKNNNSLLPNNFKNAYFKIFYDNDKHLYYIIDLGVGYGTFYKINEEVAIKENTIVNIGESYLVFSFQKENMDKNDEINEDDLFLKIYSSEGEFIQNSLYIILCR